MNRKGFTLIELLIVIAIIGIISAIAIPAYVGQQKRAARSEAAANLTNLRLLQEQVFADQGRYRPNPDGTAVYTETSQTMQAAANFPRFLPGNPTDLVYDYRIISSGTGTAFVATAIAKAGRRASGDLDCTINQNNIKNGPCW